jgi:hypothetical protein
MARESENFWLLFQPDADPPISVSEPNAQCLAAYLITLSALASTVGIATNLLEQFEI